MKKPVVLLYEPIHAEGLAVLQKMAQVRYAPGWAEEEVLPMLDAVEGIIIRANGRNTRRLMEAAPRLKVVGRHGVGLDNVDVAAATELGICVVNTPDANAESVAEHALGLMIALAKKIVRADKAAHRGEWHARYEYIGTELRDKTLGLVGFGRIGQRTATLCHLALQMPILYYDVVDYPDVEAELDARRMSLEDLLFAADVVSVHVPLLPTTRGLIGEAEFRRMKPTAYFINTSRGGVVQEADLIAALQEGRIAGAGLDVFESEPIGLDHPFLSMDNVTLTPHTASYADATFCARDHDVGQTALTILRGEVPRWVANPAVLDHRRTD